MNLKEEMYQTLIIQPFLGAIQSNNRKTGQKGGPIQSTISMIQTAIIGTIIWIEVSYGGSPVTIKQIEWIGDGYQNIEWSQMYDSQTSSMLQPVLYVSAQVQQYSQGYMEGDPHKSRFFSYLSLFTFFMQILITGDNLQVLFVGWEGVGLASYLQINFWYTRIAANMAAQKAFQMNRVGDWGQTLGILQIIAQIGDVSYPVQLTVGQYIDTDWIFIISILIQIGASAKSAQQGLHTWQSTAMEGPTPVSAQIHAATMVTAGVYQQIRQSPLQEWSSDTLQMITWLGGCSALQGAACGQMEHDQKKVIAFSTTSQQGYMVIACGQSQYNQSQFHLINHAFFKALLFLSAGSVIHALLDQQDMRKMGGLILFIPFTYSMILQGSQSQMAFPFQTGFYSKDVILEMSQIPTNFTRSIAYILSQIAAFLSATYSVRLQIMTFISKPHFTYTTINYISEPNIFMLIPQIFQGIGAAIFGYIFQETFIGGGSTFYQNSIFIHPNHNGILDGTQSQPSFMKYIPQITLISLITIIPQSRKAITTIIKNTNHIPSNNKQPIFQYTSILNHFNIFNHWFIYKTMYISNIILRYWDRGQVEIIGPQGIIKFIHYNAFKIEQIGNGKQINYASIIIVFAQICIQAIVGATKNIPISQIIIIILIIMY